VYWSAHGSSAGLLVNMQSSGATPAGWQVCFGGTGDNINFEITGSYPLIQSSSTLPKNAWTHVAVVRSGSATNNIKMYFNGVVVAQGTNTSTIDSTNASFYAGTERSITGFLTGYISGARIVKGTAVYTAAFTPPTAPPTAITNTSLLLNFTNAGILDGTMKNNLETVADAKVSTSVVKYGSGSLAFDGTGDQLYIPSSPIFGVGTGQFTIEFWLRFNAVPTYYTSMFCGVGYGFMQMRTRSGGANLEWGDAGGTERAFATQSWAANQWYHIAITRDASNIVRIFVDGVNKSDATYTVTTSYSATPFIIAGGQFNNLNGYMDDFRFTTGIARYTQNFIPPSVALPRQ